MKYKKYIEEKYEKAVKNNKTEDFIKMYLKDEIEYRKVLNDLAKKNKISKTWKKSDIEILREIYEKNKNIISKKNYNKDMTEKLILIRLVIDLEETNLLYDLIPSDTPSLF